jgi:hypothetical protein
MLHGFDLSNVLLVDNNASSFRTQLANGVPISSWRGEVYDMELLKLSNYLKDLALAPNLREANGRTFDLSNYCRRYERINSQLKHSPHGKL